MKRSRTPKPVPISPLFLIPPNPLFEEADAITQQIMRSMKKYIDKLDAGHQPAPDDQTLNHCHQAMKIATMASRNYALSDRRNNPHLYRVAFLNRKEPQHAQKSQRSDDYEFGKVLLRAAQRLSPAQKPQPQSDPAAKEPV